MQPQGGGVAQGGARRCVEGWEKEEGGEEKK